MTVAEKRKLTIDKEFAELLGILTDEERKQLEANLKAAGRAYTPIIVWEGTDIIVDGRNRYELCEKHGLDYDVEEMPFADREAAIHWIFENQSGRRNMTPERLTVLRAKLYKALRKEVGGQPGTRVSQDGGVEVGDGAKSTAELVSEMTGVSPSQVKADVRFSDALDKLTVRLREGVVNGDIDISKQQVFLLAARSRAEQSDIYREVKSGNTTWREALGQEPTKHKKGKRKKSKKVMAELAAKHRGQLDDLGNEVPEKLCPIFERRPEFSALERDLKSIAARVRIVKGGPAGHYLTEEIAAGLEATARLIYGCRPYAITEDGDDWMNEGDATGD